jgi:hypothetical protein
VTEHRRQWLEKWGLVTAIATVLSVALLVVVQLAIISRWTGAQETKTQVACDKLSVLENSVQGFPDRYYSKGEALQRWDQHLRKESEERIEIINSFKRMDDKLDRIYDMALNGKGQARR